MKYKSGYFNFKTDDILRKVSSDVPHDKQGVYIIYKECISFENIIYIGKAGTISQLGNIWKTSVIWKNQQSTRQCETPDLLF